MIPLIWLSRHSDIDAIGPWDTGILRRMFEGSLWPTGAEFSSTWQNMTAVPHSFWGQPGVVVLPARHHYADTEWLNTEINKLSGVLLILSSDEDAGFPWKEIKHSNITMWVQSPDDNQYGDCPWAYRFGYGWRYDFPDLAKKSMQLERSTMWSFSGQVTNEARQRAAKGLRRARSCVPGTLNETSGFSQGLEADVYAELLADTWVAPCPAGPATLDTFRLYEALESGCVPLVDKMMPGGSMAEFWKKTYGQVPFPLVESWEHVANDIEAALAIRHRLSAQCSTWWQQTKRAMVQRLESDLRQIGAEFEPWTKTTILVTASPIMSHPSTDVIMETIASIPDSYTELIIAMDGVRPEQEHLREAYDEFVYRICQWCEHTGHPAIPVLAPTWLHQTGLTRLALRYVTTPTVLFMEHDTPILADRYIDWNGIVDLVEQNHLDVIRFHHEEEILAVHEYLMIDHETKEMLGVPLRRTRQWSQRPAVYNTLYFKRILDENFTPRSRCFIEDRMHSFAKHQDGHRLAIYHPEGHGIRRSGHIDGRGSAPKYDDSQIF